MKCPKCGADIMVPLDEINVDDIEGLSETMKQFEHENNELSAELEKRDAEMLNLQRENQIFSRSVDTDREELIKDVAAYQRLWREADEKREKQITIITGLREKIDRIQGLLEAAVVLPAPQVDLIDPEGEEIDLEEDDDEDYDPEDDEDPDEDPEDEDDEDEDDDDFDEHDRLFECPSCHGKGVFDGIPNLEPQTCDLCNGSGKITSVDRVEYIASQDADAEGDAAIAEIEAEAQAQAQAQAEAEAEAEAIGGSEYE